MKSLIETFLNGVNKSQWSEHGSGFQLMEEDVCELREMFHEGIEENDLVIHYDYCTDEMNDDQKNEFLNWLYVDKETGWESVRTLMRLLGYKRVDEIDVDGSGNGLYYGIEVYRKGE
jgi:hypothetical protein